MTITRKRLKRLRWVPWAASWMLCACGDDGEAAVAGSDAGGGVELGSGEGDALPGGGGAFRAPADCVLPGGSYAPDLPNCSAINRRGESFTSPVPRRVLAAGDGFGCALGAAGGVYCFEPVPLEPDLPAAVTRVEGVEGAVAVTADDDAICARRADASVQCWGGLFYPGDGTANVPDGPVDVHRAHDVIDFDVDGEGLCIVLANGSVRCVGEPTPSSSGRDTVPTPLAGIDDAVSVVKGTHHTCVSHATGRVSCWGGIDYGQLGTRPEADGSAGGEPAYASPEGIASATQLAAGQLHTCALLAEGSVACWGQLSPSLGDGATANSEVPVFVAGITDAIAIAAGTGYGCALRATGGVECWGAMLLRSGPGEQRYSTPISVENVSGAVALAGSDANACALLGDDTVRCWGGAFGLSTSTRATAVLPR